MERQQRRFEGAIMVAKEGRDLKEQNTAQCESERSFLLRERHQVVESSGY